MKSHNFQLTPKNKGSGGITKYEDEIKNDLNYELLESNQM